MEFITVMEWIGTVAFAVSGAVVAIQKRLDWYGICILSIITAIGGGILRDILINRPIPASLTNPMYAIVSVASAAFVMFFYKRVRRANRWVLVADAFGLAAFTAIGAEVSALSGHPDIYVTVTLAVLTGTCGGVLRDVLVMEIPQCFRKDIYAWASLAGAVVYSLTYSRVSLSFGLYLCFGVTLSIRLAAIFYNLHWRKNKWDYKKQK